jgi:uncharacterized protein with PhoU and TrkA domain
VKPGWLRSKLGELSAVTLACLKLSSRIAGLLSSPSLASNKLDELKIKANILSSFAAKRVGEAYDAAGEMAGDATQAIKDAAAQASDSAEDLAQDATEAVKEKAAQVSDGAKAAAGVVEEKLGKVTGEL